MDESTATELSSPSVANETADQTVTDTPNTTTSSQPAAPESTGKVTLYKLTQHYCVSNIKHTRYKTIFLYGKL